MAEFIEREAVRREIDEHRPGRSYEDAWALTILDSIPAADVRPVVRGKWSRVYDDFMKSNYDTCSCCGKEYFGAYGFNFCPNCGADMRELEDEKA